MLVGAASAALLAVPGAASAQVTSQVQNGDLTVTSDAGDAIVLTDVGGNVKINGADPGNGPAASSTIDTILVTGGPDANNIDLKGVTGAAFPALASVSVDGAGGDDLINGTQLADTLEGGDGNDRIIGDDNQPNTRDDMRGENGDDTLVWNPGDDDDINEGGPGNDTAEVNGGGKEQFEVKPSATPGRVAFDRVQPDTTFGAPFSVDISDDTERLDLNAGGDLDIINAAAGLDALAFGLDIDGGDGDDTIDGGDGADRISGGNGNDRLTGDDNPLNTRDVVGGDAGDDTMIWNGGDDDDVNEGGDGNDTVEVNGANLPEAFTVKPSATQAGRVVFDRLATPGPGPFNIDIGTSERLDLNANGGDDTVTADAGFSALRLDVDGGDGNDSLDGGDAADRLSGDAGNDRLVGDDNPAGSRDESLGGAGDDTMVWNPGDDDDINEGGDGNDTVEVNGDGPEEFEVKPAAVPGRVSFDRTNPAPFNIDIGTSEQLVLNAGDGNDKIAGSKGLAGLISSAFNGDDGDDRIKGTDGEDLLTGGKGKDLIRARDKAADRVEGDAGFDLAFVDRRDTVRGVEIVIGGPKRVRHLGGKALVVKGSAVAVKLRSVGTGRTRGRVHLIRGGKSLGSVKYNVTRKPKTFRIKLNRRGLRLVARAPRKGLSVKLRIDARDSNGNGWRTSDSLRLKR
ncbi:MAG TPA: calcium-binding protein [Thermoleophilaceae bacterium]|nr:calcium-binding protein [Thermoleophilaceae bacterium]